MVVIEVCVEGPQGVRAARAAGAERVELCSSLGTGGLTPSHGALAASAAFDGIELVALVRPRGGDFVHSEEELAWMERDIACARELGAAGVALGCLTREGEIDEASSARLIRSARPLAVTFHRAFDFVRAPEEALERLVRLGAARVLTSGQAASASAGQACLARLVSAARGRIQVVAAGGVRADNARELVRATGVEALHFSASVRRADGAGRGSSRARLVGAERGEGADEHWETDESRVRAVIAAVRGGAG